MDALRRFANQLRDYWNGLGPARRAALAAVAVGIAVALAAVIYLAPGQTYRPLFTGLDPADAGAMRTTLTGQNIPVRVSADGSTVEVPEDRLADARVALAGAGLPAGAGKGYELFDETSLTTTPFVQTVNYQRALQAELARSIQKLEPVKSARVLIARPEPTPFVRDQRPPTASVVIQLKPGAALSRATAAGITSLVARSVEGLKPENVTVVDSSGRMLSDPHAGDRDSLPAPQLEYRRELETYLSTKAEELLAQHLGAGRAVVRVSADVNFQQMKERKRTVYPDEKLVVAERTTSVKGSSAGGGGGVVGAVSNVARASAPLGGGGGRSSSGGSSSEEVIQTDYAYSESVRDLEDRMGGVTRLTIAALVDLSGQEGSAVLSADDAQDLIKQAVGFRQGRDDVKVTNVRLPSLVGPAEPDQEAVRVQRLQGYVALARNVLLAVAIVLALAVVPLLLLRRRRKTAAQVEAERAREAAAVETARAEGRRQADLNRLAELARTDPDRAADVFKLLVG
ncbi:MAG: flagellar M-ring protein FliF [Gemmataceae bacterium]|nr:flagellar M-ring protein FliF [Gemmataceae bacterium]